MNIYLNERRDKIKSEFAGFVSYSTTYGMDLDFEDHFNFFKAWLKTYIDMENEDGANYEKERKIT